MNTNPLNGRRVKHGQLKDDDKGQKSRVCCVFCCTNDERFIFSLSLFDDIQRRKTHEHTHKKKPRENQSQEDYLTHF